MVDRGRALRQWYTNQSKTPGRIRCARMTSWPAILSSGPMLGMLSVLAELQRELIVANTNDGLASARARGRVSGRRPKLTADQAALAQRLYDEREKAAGDTVLTGTPNPEVSFGRLTGLIVRFRRAFAQVTSLPA